MEDKSHAPRQPARKTDLAAINAVRKLQVNPDLGAFRIHAVLLRREIELSPHICGWILALSRELYGLRGPSKQTHEPKKMPFKAVRRHQYRIVDLPYLDHNLEGGNVYCISILENYSRAILAGGISRSQDLTAFLIVLFAAVRQHGAPEVLVSDSGGIFLAGEAKRIYRALRRRKEEIDRGQAWQSYIETTFNIQHPAADGRLALCPGPELERAAGGARSLGSRLQLSGPLGASRAGGRTAEPGRGAQPGDRHCVLG
jgi:putative transposase